MNQNIKAAAIVHADHIPDHFRSGAIDDFMAGATYFQQLSGADEMAEALGKLLTNLERDDEIELIKNAGNALIKYNSFIKKEEDGKENRS